MRVPNNWTVTLEADSSTLITIIKERKNDGASFKTKVVLGALKERESVSELSQRFGVSPTLISNWKKAFLESASTLFESKGKSKEPDKRADELFKQIGQLKAGLAYCISIHRLLITC